jgi:hypothetical protein
MDQVWDQYVKIIYFYFFIHAKEGINGDDGFSDPINSMDTNPSSLTVEIVRRVRILNRIILELLT